VRDWIVGRPEHPALAIERLVDELRVERNLSYSPIFRPLFVLDQDAGNSSSMTGPAE